MKSLHSAAVEVQFTNDDYRAIESSGVMPVVVTKNRRIATPLTISINPLTVAQANSEGVLPEGIPLDNPFAPPYAGIHSNKPNQLPYLIAPTSFCPCGCALIS